MTCPVAVQFGPFRLDAARRLLLRDGDAVALTPKAFDALVFLVACRDRVVSKQELVRTLWPDTAVEDATLSQHIFMVRRALNGAGDHDAEYIATVPRRGYRFVAPVITLGSAHVECAGAVAETSQSGAAKIAAFLVAIAVVVMMVTWTLRPHAAVGPPKIIRLAMPVPEDQRFWRMGRGVAALSSDGGSVVYAANRQLYLRKLSETEAHPIQGTDLDVSMPFFSPDGQWIGFWSADRSMLNKIAVGGGAAIALAPASNPHGASWRGDTIVFAEGGKGIMSVSASGGSPRLWVAAGEDELFRTPQILPGEEAVLFTVSKTIGNRIAGSNVAVYSRRAGVRNVLISGAHNPRYVATGHIVYASAANLFAVPFDAQRLQLTGSPRVIVEKVTEDFRSGTNFDVSAAGTLIHVPNSAAHEIDDARLTLIDRNGKREVLAANAGSYSGPRVSSDGRHLAVATDEDGGTIWVYDLRPGSSPRRLTFDGHSRFPVWSPDGRRIAFGSTREGSMGIFVRAADGTGLAERLTTPQPGFEHVPGSWSADGTTLAFSNVKAGTKDTIWTVGVADRQMKQVLAVAGSNQMDPSFSPDGRWIAYSSEGEAGHSLLEVVVQPFPPTGAKYQISRDGGELPAWSPDGRRLIYHKVSSRDLVSVRIRTEPSISLGDPHTVSIDGLSSAADYDVLRDGRFVAVVTSESGGTSRPAHQLDVVLNWFEAIRR